MRKLGTWSGALLVTLLLTAGLSGRAPAQEREVPWLGVVTQSLSGGLREGMDYRGEGVLVSRVMDDSPADRAGLRQGDILVTVNSRSVRSPEQLTQTIRDMRVGQQVSLVVVRDGQRRTLSVRLAARPDDTPAPEPQDFDRLRDLPRDLEELPEMRDEGGAGFVFRGMGRGRLGVRVEDLNPDLAGYFDTPPGSGALVLEVLQDTPASKAGLKAGDVITQVGDQQVSDADDLVRALRETPEGRVTVTVLRKGAKRDLEAELDPAPRAFRAGPGRDLMGIWPRDRRVVVPEVRREVRRDGAMRDELRQLREELRELREKLDRLEGGRN